ncbi:mannosyltransferase [Coemansia sp. RSA 552]|nr:mannosyltransferase [Coemansia sp. RSA 552]
MRQRRTEKQGAAESSGAGLSGAGPSGAGPSGMGPEAGAGRLWQAEHALRFGKVFLALLVVRLVGAAAAPVQDCDEVFNYWEALHAEQFGRGKQTWEYAPQFALRSWAYVRVHALVLAALRWALGMTTKAQLFYALRAVLATASAACEAALVCAAGRWVGRDVAAWTELACMGMAGLFHAAPALLPSSFAMCAVTVGAAYAMPPPSRCLRVHLRRRLVPAVTAFSVAAGVGWPYAAIVAVPFAAEELFVGGSGGTGPWIVRRLVAVACTGAVALGATVGATMAVDSQYYGRTVSATWNQLAYNVGNSGRSALYGTEPWHFYLRNGLLNGNIVMVLALLSLPLWVARELVLCRMARQPQSPAAAVTLARLRRSHAGLAFRLLPFPVALLVFSLQSHKEERFLSIVYPHMCFCAAVAISLAMPLPGTSAAAASTRRCRRWPVLVLFVAALLGFLRMAALAVYYGAPVRVFAELPADNSEMGQLGQQPVVTGWPGPERTVCMGADWYYFPSSYWLPANHRLVFATGLNGDLAGHLPGDFVPASVSGSIRNSAAWPRPDFNDDNRWEPSHAVGFSADRCNYVAAIEYPDRPPLGPQWQVRRGSCHPILDARASGLLARLVYIPPPLARLLERVAGAHARQSWTRMCIYEQNLPTYRNKSVR